MQFSRGGGLQTVTVYPKTAVQEYVRGICRKEKRGGGFLMSNSNTSKAKPLSQALKIFYGVGDCAF